MRVTRINTTNMKLLIICLVSSELREFAKLMNEQYTAIHAHHLSCQKKIHKITEKQLF